MGKSKRKKHMNDKIPSKPTANISETMRKERALEGEVFENVSTAISGSLRSTKSTSLTRKLKKKKRKPVPPVNVLTEEKPIEFQNDILSIYSQTEGTISLDSVSSIGTAQVEKIKEEQKSSVLPPTATLLAERVRTIPPQPPKAIQVTDAVFCEKTNLEGPFTADHRKGDVELSFINQLISSVLAIVNESGNTNLELKITLDREDNGLPKVTFEMVPKAHTSNPIERLNRAFVQYAKFHEEMGVASDCETAISRLQPTPRSHSPSTEQQKQNGSRFSLLSVFNSVFSGFGNQKGK
ncbi:hypothetical protein RB195_019127 [Necator americanus]